MKTLIGDTVKSFFGWTEYALTRLRYPHDELIVLCMHSTPAERMPQFEQHIDWLTQRFKPLKPAELADYFAGKLSNGPYVLFTFDDGLRNNLHAARALANRGIGAVFFIVPNFIQAEDGHLYYSEHIRPIIDTKVDHQPEDTAPMAPDELRALIAMGHRVESHTFTHRLNPTMNTGELEREINHSADWIANQLATTVSSFCSPNNTLFSVSSEAKRRIAERYAYHFTTFPGLNAAEKRPLLIYRRNIEVHWSFGKLLFALGQWDLPRWRSRVEQYKAR